MKVMNRYNLRSRSLDVTGNASSVILPETEPTIPEDEQSHLSGGEDEQNAVDDQQDTFINKGDGGDQSEMGRDGPNDANKHLIGAVNRNALDSDLLITETTHPKLLDIAGGHQLGGSGTRKSHTGSRKRLRDMTWGEAQSFVMSQGIDCELSSSAYTMVELIRTSELLKSEECPKINVVLDCYLDKYLPLANHSIVRFLRANGFAEEGVRDLWVTGLRNSSQIDEYFINEVADMVRPATRALLRRMVNSGQKKTWQQPHNSDELSNDRPLRVNQATMRAAVGPGSVDKVYNLVSPLKDQEHENACSKVCREDSVRGSFKQEMGYDGHRPPSSSIRLPVKLDRFQHGMDLATWLDDCLFRLENDPYSTDKEKTLQFKLVLSGFVRQEAQDIMEMMPDIEWRELILKLRHSHLSATEQYEAQKEVQYMKFNYSEPFHEWHVKWENALRLSNGNLSREMRRLLIVQALPLEDQHQLSLHGQDKSYESILSYMTTSDCIKRSQRQKRQNEMKPLTNQQPGRMSHLSRNGFSSGYQSGNQHSKQPWKPQSTINSASNPQARPVVTQPAVNKYTNLTCHSCGKVGHIATHCSVKKIHSINRTQRQPRRRKQRANIQGSGERKPDMDTTTTEATVPKRWGKTALPLIDVIVGDDPTPDGAQICVLEKDSAKAVSTGQSIPRKINRFTIEAQFNPPINGIKSQYRVVIDTGADVSILNPNVLERLPILLYPPDSFMSGIGGASIDVLLGFCYLLVTVVEKEETRLLKVYVIEGLSGGLLFGQNFIGAFDVSLAHQKGAYNVIIGDDPQYVSPTLSIAPAETKFLERIIEREERKAGKPHPKPILLFSGTDAPPEILTKTEDETTLTIALVQ